MTPLQTKQLRASEIRQRLAALGGMAELSDEQRSEIETLRTEYETVEGQIQALTVAGDETETRAEPEVENTEDRELRDLERRSNVGEVFDAALTHSATDGAIAELQQHHGLPPNQIPLALLASDGELETRAVTPAPSNVGQQQQPIIPYVFPQSAGAFLGVYMPTVPTGEQVFPVLTSELSVEALAENAAGTETTGAFSADVLSPSRLQASFFYSREDRARFAMMDESLRQNLSDGLADGLDKQIIAGANGLLTGTNLPDNDASGVTDFGGYIDGLAYGRIDGRYAGGAADLRVVVGAGTYAHMGKVYRNTSVDRSALDRVMEVTGGVRVSAHVPAVDKDNKQNAVVRRGMRTADMLAAIWEGVEIIPDVVTKATTGQIVITAVMLHAVKILRTAGFHKQQLQHA